MIKENNKTTNIQTPLFHPTFGSRPAQIVGRNSVIETFLEGLDLPIGSRERCIFLIGQRGMGKTTLLLEMADLAKSHNMVPALVTAYEGMNEEIIEAVQRNGAQYFPKKEKAVQGFEIGALGFSFGLTFNETTQHNYGFRTKLTLLCDQLSSIGKGILLLVDEVTNSESMRQLGITYQHLVGENKNIAIVMAGLPQSVSMVLNDKVLTFLNRAEKIHLGPINVGEIRNYFAMAFQKKSIKISDDVLNQAAKMTDGYPYFMQLLGYYLLRYSKETKEITENTLNEALKSSQMDLEQNVFSPILSPLSEWDISFLKAMAIDNGTSNVSDIAQRLGKENSFIQPYRARLISAGIIESPKKGKLVFAVPYLAEYLRNYDDE